LTQLTLEQKHWDTMRGHVEHQAPLEACGLLAGKDRFVKSVILIANLSHSPVRFQMDPAEQLQAFNWMESNGLDLLAIFHSHPAGPGTPSATDVEEASYPVVQIIWSRVNGIWQARGFWIENTARQDVGLLKTAS
jgi:[CysO sulfur-carrier protein]-S-L-cysteine hydrolase